MIPHDEEEHMIELIRSKYNNIKWFQRIMFGFAILLYGIILKCPRQHQEVEVYRGVLSHYLKEDRNNGYFLNTFTSTSVNSKMARSFSKNNNNDVIIYHFILMPGVSCIYIGKNEDELLLNPYQCYRFVKKEGKHYFYIIHPLSINPPNDEEEFSVFKKDMTLRAVEMEGGRIVKKEINMKIVSEYRNRTRSKSKKNRNTKKNKMSNEMYHFKKRMNMPIGTSSISIPNTPEVMADIERVARKYYA